MYNQATVEMNNPLSPVKNVREMYCKFLQRVVTEVQVQFKDEEPAWIPLSTYEAIPGINLTSEETRYWNGELEGEEFDKALQKYGYEYTHIPSRY